MPLGAHFDPFPVRKCVCHDITFTEINASGVRSLEEIADRFGAGTGCQTCVPYLMRMLEAGETAFAVIEDDSD
jgi:bacterioferritin-associated ferredoxin